MKTRQVMDGVHWMGAIDWDRRLFDSLIPLPDGTSYNAYLIEGKEKRALIDSVDPAKVESLMSQLEPVDTIDYIVAHHAEQDHSGGIPTVLERYPKAKIVCSPKGKGMLIDLLRIPAQSFLTVEDGDSISLGDLTLEFVHTPWVHWPETMCTVLKEKKILFSCDFFGSHIATTDLFATDRERVYEAAKRYFAEIMMPFRKIIRKNLEKIRKYEIDVIAPSHGPIYDEPEFILRAYEDWASDEPKNSVVIAFASMHGSTEKMVAYLTSALAERGATVHLFNLAVADIGKLAISLVDAGTIVIGTPTVHVGAHPLAAYAAFLANMLRPKAQFASIVGSYGWSTKVVEQIASLIPNLKVDVLEPVICKGRPTPADFGALLKLADTIIAKHTENHFRD